MGLSKYIMLSRKKCMSYSRCCSGKLEPIVMVLVEAWVLIATGIRLQPAFLTSSLLEPGGVPQAHQWNLTSVIEYSRHCGIYWINQCESSCSFSIPANCEAFLHMILCCLENACLVRWNVTLHAENFFQAKYPFIWTSKVIWWLTLKATI